MADTWFPGMGKWHTEFKQIWNNERPRETDRALAEQSLIQMADEAMRRRGITKYHYVVFERSYGLCAEILWDTP